MEVNVLKIKPVIIVTFCSVTEIVDRVDYTKYNENVDAIWRTCKNFIIIIRKEHTYFQHVHNNCV